ncbi:MAG: tyrosine-type recombinase/integrase [Ignavibacteriaceae bacterium]
MRIEEVSSKYLEELKNIKRYSENTIKSYSEDLNDFLTFCNNNSKIETDQITGRFIKSYLMDLSDRKIQVKSGVKNLEKKSISRKLASLRGLFKYAFSQGIISSNPTAYLTNPKISRKLPEITTEKMILKIYGLAEEDAKLNPETSDKLIKAVFELLYGCALRVSELCSLNIGDIDLREKILRVKGKGNKTRIVPVGDKSVTVIKDYLSARNDYLSSEALLTDKKKERLYPRYIYRIVNKYLSKVTDIKKKSPHILRHSAATHMLDAGADLRAVKDILGHENLSTTQIYTHVSIERLKSAYKKSHPKS